MPALGYLGNKRNLGQDTRFQGSLAYIKHRRFLTHNKGLFMKATQKGEYADIVLIGAGIMSATLGMLLKQLQPDYRIQIFERLDMAATESSGAWNNAGPGHSAFCELNYTPELPDGSIETVKALKIAESFEVSKQFWAYLIQQNFITVPPSFIRPIPHMSFVWGEKNVEYLRKRYEALTSSHLFK